jgi:hypothetical protein
MKKRYDKRPLTGAALLCASFLVLSLTGLAFADMPPAHNGIILRDAAGAPIAAGATTNNAFSTKGTCGQCHDYDAIEKHSYHAQLGANEQRGWNPFNANSSDKYVSGPATKGKPWVQSPGHVGKW